MESNGSSGEELSFYHLLEVEFMIVYEFEGALLL